MLTGTMTPEELKERHALEYKRLFPNGSHLSNPPRPSRSEPAERTPLER